MSQPWCDPNTFGMMYGAIGGGVGGTLGGLLGAAAGYLAPRGKGRRFILGAMGLFVALGVSQLLLGFVAVSTGQPRGIWHPMLVCGFIVTIVIGCLIPVVRTRYAQAEQRRIDAEAIRRS
jgi:MFS family permease